MIRTTLAIAALALAPALGAQSTHHASAENAPCPLHLTTLALTPAQDSAVEAIRTAHMSEMKAAKPAAGADSAAKARAHETMTTSMRAALDSVRRVLDAGQLATFEAAVAAHEKEKQAMRSRGEKHDCTSCCEKHEAHDAAKHGAHGGMKHDHRR